MTPEYRFSFIIQYYSPLPLTTGQTRDRERKVKLLRFRQVGQFRQNYIVRKNI